MYSFTRQFYIVKMMTLIPPVSNKSDKKTLAAQHNSLGCRLHWLYKEGDIGVCGIAVMANFSCGISVILIENCDIAIFSKPAGFGF